MKQSASDINADLLKQYTEIQNIFKEFEVQNVMPTTEQVKDAFVLSTKIKNGAEHDKEKEPSIKFMKAYDEFVSEGSIQNAWSDSTLKKFATAKKHLNAFDPDTNFDVWTDKHFNEYIDYLRTQKDMRNSSIVKHSCSCNCFQL